VCHPILWLALGNAVGNGGGLPHGQGNGCLLIPSLVEIAPKKGYVEKTKQMSNKLNKQYVPKDEITTIPSGWNEAGSFDFLNDSREDIYSLEDGEEID